MKLLVMIPCLNEEADIARVLACIPQEIAGIDKIETLLINDGSTDNTIQEAIKAGINYVVSNKQSLGLAKTFRVGLSEAIKIGADIIVNTDGDGQYSGSDIPKLIRPILDQQADMVIGDRQIFKLTYLSLYMKLLQRLGSAVVSYFAGVRVPDAPSGFRAFSREAAIKLNVFSSYTYTLETIINGAAKGLVIKSVPIDANITARKSRLIRNKYNYIARSAATILRIFTMHNPMKVSVTLFSILMLLGLCLMSYFLFLLNGSTSLLVFIGGVIVASTLIVVAVLILIGGVIADLSHCNRLILEEINEGVRRQPSVEPPKNQLTRLICSGSVSKINFK